ncbi:unnamed protein product [Moneuplotes crassus]|uniref:Uncharacterized protein n=1 Tax=Euplotes crassus TaxID=5936 RepID=A0AAD1TYF2_EUPCR|nr:unnamed protein product [Moneuplotes crassus]
MSAHPPSSYYNKYTINYPLLHEETPNDLLFTTSISGSVPDPPFLPDCHKEPFKAIRINKLDLKNINIPKGLKIAKPNPSFQEEQRPYKSEQRKKPQFDVKGQKKKVMDIFYKTVLDTQSKEKEVSLQPKRNKREIGVCKFKRKVKNIKVLSSFNHQNKYKIARKLNKNKDITVNEAVKAITLSKSSGMKYNKVRDFLQKKTIHELYSIQGKPPQEVSADTQVLISHTNQDLEEYNIEKVKLDQTQETEFDKDPIYPAAGDIDSPSIDENQN